MRPFEPRLSFNAEAFREIENAEQHAYQPDLYEANIPTVKPHERLLSISDLTQIPGARVSQGGLKTSVALPYAAVPPELKIFHIPQEREHMPEARRIPPNTPVSYDLQPVSVGRFGVTPTSVMRNYYVEVGGHIRIKRRQGIEMNAGQAVESRTDNEFDPATGFLTESRCYVKDKSGKWILHESVVNQYDAQGRMQEQRRVKADGTQEISRYDSYTDEPHDYINVTGSEERIKRDGSRETSQVSASYHKKTGFSSSRGGRIGHPMAQVYIKNS